MPAAKRVGVSDIAKHAGVSIGTVSNYLNYPERVSDTLKEKIGASIKELGYTPRRNTLLPQRENAVPRLIGYIMTDIEHSLFTFIHEGAQEVCEENDLQLIALNASSDAQRQNELVKTLIDMNVAGILLSTISDSPEDVAAARAANIPIILLDHTNPRHADQVCCVLENNMAAGRSQPMNSFASDAAASRSPHTHSTMNPYKIGRWASKKPLRARMEARNWNSSIPKV